jgi:hypothetical protein
MEICNCWKLERGEVRLIYFEFELDFNCNV